MAMMFEPNYASYTLDELLDCKANIDAQAWPERLKDIENALSVYASQSAEHEKQYKQAVFNAYCETLRHDLTISIDDNILWFLRPFSKQAKDITPSTFAGEVCPLCKGDISATTWAAGWQLSCEHCEVTGIVVEKFGY